MLERRKGLVPLRSTQRTRAASEVAWVCVLEDSREGKRVPFFEGEPLRLREWAYGRPRGRGGLLWGTGLEPPAIQDRASCGLDHLRCNLGRR